MENDNLVPQIYHQFHRGLLQVHQELRDGAAKILHLADRGYPYRDLAEAIMPFCEELLNHHKSEDAFFFPGIRHAGRLKSSDIAFLDARDAEHIPIHALCETLLRLGKTIEAERGISGENRRQVSAITNDLTEISLPHFHIEEVTLTPAHMQTLMSERQLADVYRDMGQNWNKK